MISLDVSISSIIDSNGSDISSGSSSKHLVRARFSFVLSGLVYSIFTPHHIVDTITLIDI